tara:strand:+ start:1061 stop:2233 length:1173 start_codon:yes stop_codon:yes gene_type:complete
MVKDLIILGSTGSIGVSTLNIVRKNINKLQVKLLSTNSNINKILSQALEFKVKHVLIFNKEKYKSYKYLFNKNKIKVYFELDDIVKLFNKKVFYTINAISGISGLEPTLKIIKCTNNIAIANKESIICGWKFIDRALKKNNTNFIPVDSEHFSIWSLLKNENINNINKIYLTASGGPFLNKNINQIKNIKPKYALKHPNWSMGKKISIDSSTMMNKIFEVIEAVKIFNLNINKFGIIIHPKSYIHAIVNFKTGLSKFLVHDTNMEIPIINSIYYKNEEFEYFNKRFDFEKLNGLNFIKPNIKKFPLLKILNMPIKNTYFETILISVNDELVKKYLNKEINYISIQTILLKLIKDPYFTKYYKSTPRNLDDIKSMVNKVTNYMNKYIKYEK